MKTKRKQRVPARLPEPLVVQKGTGQCWSMGFMSDRLESNVRFCIFNVIEDCSRELLGIDIGTGSPSARVICYLDKSWPQHGVYIDYTQPDCLYQNAYIERFNRTYRQEVLDLSLFTSLKDVQHITKYWATCFRFRSPIGTLLISIN